MNELRECAKSKLNDFISRNGILDFLHLILAHPQLSIENLLLFATQNLDAGKSKGLCGKKAWESLGRSVLDNAKPIYQVFPVLSYDMEADTISYEERMVKTYSYEDTEGEDVRITKPVVHLSDAITRACGNSWELVKDNDWELSMVSVAYNMDENIFYMKESVAKAQPEYAELTVYLQFMFEKRMITDKLLKNAVSYLIYEYFGVKHAIVGSLFGKLSNLSEAEKMTFAIETRFVFRDLLAQLIGYEIDFDGVAILNGLLISDDLEIMRSRMEKAGSVIGDKRELSYTIENLIEQLNNVGVKERQRLVYLKLEQRLFSFPMVRIEKGQ